MKAYTIHFFVCILLSFFIVVISQSSITYNNQPNTPNSISITDRNDEDCYTYERVYINGAWWICVYDCDGILIYEVLEDDD